MAVFIAFLRGINVGGRSMLSMAALKEMCDDLGFKNTRTLLQSGNVVFTASRTTTASLAKKIADAISKRFQKDIFIAVRTPDELKAIVKRNPFADAARDDPGHLVAMFLSGEPTAAAAKALAATAAKFTAERSHLAERELYVHYASGIGTSKFTNTLIEKTLAVHGTARNWNTVTKLIALATVLGES